MTFVRFGACGRYFSFGNWLMFSKILPLKNTSRIFTQSGSLCSSLHTMQPAYASLQAVVAKLNEFAPENLAEKWDNVGLLVEPLGRRNIHCILLTIDLTERVMEEALHNSAELIISYHPPIFAPLKRITQKTWKERLIHQCVRNDIAVYSPHTSWDSVTNGVNDWLAAALPLASSQPIQENLSNPSYGAGRICVVQGEMMLPEAALRIKQHTKLEHVMVGAAPEASGRIRTFAVCAGSGASVLKGVKADLYITGEMSHHEILEAQHQNTNVILLGHCNSERGYLPVFKGVLTNLLKDFGSVEILISKMDCDPLKSVHHFLPATSN